MSQLIAGVILVLLVAFTVFSVASGTWYGTWCASGRKEGGRRFPGGPTEDPKYPSLHW
jgi:hypothetical protein